MSRQLFQSGGQFAIIFFTGLLVYKEPPSSLEEFWSWAWQPMLQAITGALGVWGFSKIPVGGTQTVTRRDATGKFKTE